MQIKPPHLLHLHFDYIISAVSAIAKHGHGHEEIIDAIVVQKRDEAERAHKHTILFQQRFLVYLQRNLVEDLSVS